MYLAYSLNWASGTKETGNQFPSVDSALGISAIALQGVGTESNTGKIMLGIKRP